MRGVEGTIDFTLPRAAQQPDWPDPAAVERTRREIAVRPPLVPVCEVLSLRAQLAEVAQGRAHVLQAGDCAEDPAEHTEHHVLAKAALLDMLADTLAASTGTEVVRVGRIGGQFAKPRSSNTERVEGVELPVFRGHMVNDPAADLALRQPDPARVSFCLNVAETITARLARRAGPRIWTSHEALLLDYEEPMVRTRHRETWLSSAHWPWIGERTRQPDGAHVELLASVVNPVACKIGPSTDDRQILELCARLDPLRSPGRLTLISRMGARTVADRLPGLVEAVRAEGYPVIWLCDPMHGNAVVAPSGKKTRVLETLIEELRLFCWAVSDAGGVAGGVHLETTPDDVLECVATVGDLGSAVLRHTTFCDPRLNPAQAVTLVSAWSRHMGD
mgnify:CR=1 FL=1